MTGVYGSATFAAWRLRATLAPPGRCQCAAGVGTRIGSAFVGELQAPKQSVKGRPVLPDLRDVRVADGLTLRASNYEGRFLEFLLQALDEVNLAAAVL